jgi:hypothetical protein
MLYIATVHYKSAKWIEIQARYLREHISVPYQTWTSLEQIDASYGVHFDRVFEQRGTHSEKLNHLALEITHEASESDLLMFLDGDAFPIADPMPLINDGLSSAALLAVRRAENANEPQPHPCFCVTTVGTWRGLPGDWSGGYTWPGAHGILVSDVGGNLLRALELTATPWQEVLRSNGTRLNPLFFAIYGNTVYHHGAGFRTTAVVSRADQAALPELYSVAPAGGVERIPGLRRIPGVQRINPSRRRYWKRRTEERDRMRSTAERNLQQSQLVFDKIDSGDPDWFTDLGQD